MRSLVLVNPTVVPGEMTTANGVGCAAGSPVVLTLDGRQVADTVADAEGNFSAPISPPVGGVGSFTVIATCGTTQLTTLLSVVTSMKVSTPEGGTAVFGVFVLVGAVLLRGQYVGTKNRRRRRNRVADILKGT